MAQAGFTRPPGPPTATPTTGTADRVFDPKVVRTLDQVIDEEARAAGISTDLLRRVISQESARKSKAVSPKGARGFAQLMPDTAKDLGVDPDIPRENIRGGAQYLRQQLDAFGGDEAKALAAYNAGPGAVRKYGGIPPFKETQNYVQRIQSAPSAPPPAPPPVAPVMASAQTGTPPAAPGMAPAPVPPDSGQDVIFEPTAVQPVAAAPGLVHPLSPLVDRLGSGLIDFASDFIDNPADAVTSRAREGVAAGIDWLREGGRRRVRETAATTLPTAGALVGGTVGGRFGGPQGALGGSLLGGELGELSSMGVDIATGAPPTYDEAQRRVAITGVTSLVGEGVPQLGIKAGKAVVGHLQPIAREARARLGHILTPAQASDSRALGLIENVIEGSIAGGGPRKALISQQESRLAQERAGEIAQFGGPVSREQAGRNVQDALTRDPRLGPTASSQVADQAEAQLSKEMGEAEGQVRAVLDRVRGTTPKAAGEGAQTARKSAVDAFRAQERELYGDFEQKAGGVLVPQARRLDEFAQQLLGREKGNVAPGVGLRAAQKVAQLFDTPEGAVDLAEVMIGGRPASSMGGAVRQAALESLEMADDVAEPLTAVQFQRTVSSLNKVVRQLTKAAQTDPSKNADLGMAKRLQQLAREDLEEILATESPEALEALTRATGFSRAENQRLFNDSVRKMAKAAPEKVTDLLLQRNNSTAITLVRDAIGEGSMQPVRDAALARLLRPNAKTDRIALDQVLSRLDQIGDDTLDALFPGREHAAIRSLAQRMQGRASLVASIRKAAIRPPDTAEVKFLKRITAAQPDAVVGMLLSPRRPLPARIVREAVGATVWRDVQASATEQILRNAKNGRELTQALEGLGKDTLRDLYPDGADAGLWSLARIQSHLEKPREGTGKVAIQLMQASAGVSLIVNPFGVFGSGNERERATTAGVIVLGPAALSRVLMSPVGRRYLIAAAEGKSGTAAVARAAGHLSMWASRELAQEFGEGDSFEAEERDPNLPPNPLGPLPKSGPPPPNPFGTGGR